MIPVTLVQGYRLTTSIAGVQQAVGPALDTLLPYSKEGEVRELWRSLERTMHQQRGPECLVLSVSKTKPCTAIIVHETTSLTHSSVCRAIIPYTAEPTRQKSGVSSDVARTTRVDHK